MIAVILTVHILVVAALIVVVLLQRSEGGALFSGGGFMTGRGTANALTRMTSALAGVFFLTSLGLAWIASHKPKDASLIEQVKGQEGAPVKPGEATSTDLLRSLGSGQAPAGAAPSAPAAGSGAPAGAPAAAPTDSEILDQPPPAPASNPPAPSEPAPAQPAPQGR